MKTFREIRRRMGGEGKWPRTYLAIALPLAIPLFLAAIRIDPQPAPTVSKAALHTPEIRYDELTTPLETDLPAHSVILTVESDDTLDSVFTRGGLSSADSARLTRQFGEHVDVRRLRPGHMLRFHYDEQGTVDAVQMKVNGWGHISASRTAAGFDVSAHAAAIREVETTVSATVDRSLYEAIRDAGEGPAVVQSLIDVFQWDIDFFELQKGDSFSFVVTKKYVGNDLAGYGPILAARFTHKGNTFEAFRHESPDGRAGYYSRTGTPLRKQFLRAPLKFTRVTSGFTHRRFHPVLKIFRPHPGVDYGAPVGTPVMTTADGVVVEARYKPGEGNFIRVRHSSRIDTCYLHLSRFAKGLKKGTKVTQGDVIGYVGSTGLSTGPHLDYRVSDGGKWLNPLSLKSITPDPLGGESLRRFRVQVASRLSRLDEASQPHAQGLKAAARRALF